MIPKLIPSCSPRWSPSWSSSWSSSWFPSWSPSWSPIWSPSWDTHLFIYSTFFKWKRRIVYDLFHFIFCVLPPDPVLLLTYLEMKNFLLLIFAIFWDKDGSTFQVPSVKFSMIYFISMIWVKVLPDGSTYVNLQIKESRKFHIPKLNKLASIAVVQE